MPFVPAPNLIMVEFRYLFNSQKCENRIMCDNLGTVGDADLTDLATGCWDWWESDYSEHISGSVLLSSVVATDLTTIDGAQYTYAPDTTTTGQTTEGSMPNEVSLCVSLRTGHRGRSARGRWYVAGLPREQMVNDNEVTSAYQSAIASDLSSLLLVATDLSKVFVIASFISEGAPRPGGPVYFPITTATVLDPIVDSMKSRKPGIGS